MQVLEEMERKIEELSSLISIMKERQNLFYSYIQENGLEQDYQKFEKEWLEKHLELEETNRKRLVKTPRL